MRNLVSGSAWRLFIISFASNVLQLICWSAYQACSITVRSSIKYVTLEKVCQFVTEGSRACEVTLLTNFIVHNRNWNWCLTFCSNGSTVTGDVTRRPIQWRSRGRVRPSTLIQFDSRLPPSDEKYMWCTGEHIKLPPTECLLVSAIASLHGFRIVLRQPRIRHELESQWRFGRVNDGRENWRDQGSVDYGCTGSYIMINERSLVMSTAFYTIT